MNELIRISTRGICEPKLHRGKREGYVVTAVSKVRVVKKIRKLYPGRDCTLCTHAKDLVSSRLVAITI
jgi:hypothetical protein